MPLRLPVIRGRGAADNPANRFVRIDLVPDADAIDPDDPAPSTIFLKDTTRQIIATNDSPDVGFTHSINPYRGCEHGCVYCYARPTHEWLGFSAGLDFESRIMVKLDAPQLLRKEISAPRYEPVMLAMSGVTDCYQPAERKFKITRGCLEVLAEFNNPVGIITKNHLVTRDIDLLSKLASQNAAVVLLSITTLDSELSSRMEPRASAPRRRLDAIAELTAAGIPAGVMAAPVIPGLTDHEIPAILKAAAQAGARWAGYTAVRLPFAVADLFSDWLARHYPDRREKVLNRIREMRGGQLNDPDFGTRMRGEGIWAKQIKELFAIAKRSAGITGKFPELSTANFKRPQPEQMNLW
jgi:DNA repair photolyase